MFVNDNFAATIGIDILDTRVETVQNVTLNTRQSQIPQD